ncbi:MAG: ATP-binding protein [Desertifilum sp.]|nr:ATP-binding protein [Desertifilum sp.]
MEQVLKILVVDDDQVDRMAVRRALKQGGMSIELAEATDCASALNELRSSQFDCVFLDYRLPDGDGLTLLQAVNQAGIRVPLVVLTGQGDEQIAVELMKAGAADYLSKDKISADNLAQILRNAIRIHTAEMQAALATQKLKESEQRYRFVLEGSNDGIWDWDLRENQIYWNDRLLEITGLSRDEFPGTYEAFIQLLHPDDQERIQAAIAAHLENNTEYNVELRLRHSSGEYRVCTSRAKAQRSFTGQPFRMAGIISDITERKRVEETLRFLAEASERVSSTLDYQRSLENLASFVVPQFADWCAIQAVDASHTLECVAVAHVDPDREDAVWELQRRYPVLPDLPQCREFGLDGAENPFDRAGCEVSDEEFEPEHLELLRSLNCRSYLCVPMRVGMRTMGSILLVMSDSLRRYTRADITLAENLARRAALAVENARLYNEAQLAGENLRRAIQILCEQQQQLRTLQRLTNLLNQRLTDLPELLQVIVDATCEAIADAEFGLILLYNPQSDQLELTATAELGYQRLRLRDPGEDEQDLLNRVFLSGDSLLLQGIEEEKTLLGVSPAAVCAVPIESAQKGRLGVLAIGSWEDQRAFDGEDRRLLIAFGEQAAIAINNAQMISDLEEREVRLETTNQLLTQQNRELDRQRQQIELQNHKLQEAARLKSQFLATMSHELRTPMNAIIGFSQLLLRQRQHSLAPQQEDMMQRILSNAKHLLTMINDILDLSKLEAGRIELKLASFDLMDLVESTVSELHSLAAEKHLSLTLDPQLVNPWIVNDRDRLRQVLVNLLSNAIKFTETGGVRITLCEINNDGCDRLGIEVCDTGIGIAPDDMTHIFEEFRQVDQTTTRKYSGTGLGLAITDWLVQMMQGQITVDSELGRGSTFYVEFPRIVEKLEISATHRRLLLGNQEVSRES